MDMVKKFFKIDSKYVGLCELKRYASKKGIGVKDARDNWKYYFKTDFSNNVYLAF